MRMGSEARVSKAGECHTVLATGARDWPAGRLVAVRALSLRTALFLLRSRHGRLIAGAPVLFFATWPSAGGPRGCLSAFAPMWI